MRDNLGGAIWRLTIFLTVCSLGIFVMLAVFAELRFEAQATYRAEFSNVSGLASGNFVRIAGVEVGKVRSISINPDATVNVEFSADDSVVLTAGTKAVVRYDNLIGDRYLALEQGAGGLTRLQPGDTIPTDRTQPALDLDALIGGFRPLFRALDPDQINALSSQLIMVFQGQGDTIGSFFAQTAALTNTLADRDQLIGQVIDNLNTVLGSLADGSEKFGLAIESLSELMNSLAARRSDISAGVAHADEAARTLAELLTQARPPLQATVRQTDRTASIVVADHDYLDNLVNTLPEKYQVLARQGLYGDYFGFYLCDAVLKLNGKGGQPVYVKIAGQTSGRCAPR